MVVEMEIKKVKKLIFGNNIHHVDTCRLQTLEVKELAKGHWKNLLNLTIRNDIIIKVRAQQRSKMSKMKGADNLQ